MAQPLKKNGHAARRNSKADAWEKNVLPILADFPALAKKLGLLSLREQIVFVAAVLDAGLVHLISRRLNGPARDIDEFLGTAGEGDARAPCGSFGSRIQLARLVGVITAGDAELLRAVKKLRNHVAHAVEIELESEAVAEGLLTIYTIFKPIQSLMLALAEMVVKKKDSPLFVEFERLAPVEWHRLNLTAESVEPQWQEKIIQPITAIYDEYRREGKMLPTETPIAVILSSIMEELFRNKTNVKASANLLFPTVLAYYKARFDFILRGTKPVDGLAESFDMLSPKFVGGAPEPAKE